MTSHSSTEIQVWDRFVRIAHWTVAIGFLVAYLTEDAMLVHVWAGYVIGILVVLRIVWGFVGPSYVRFDDFVYNLATVLAYSWDLLRLGGRQYVGHSPVGGAMVIALLLSLSATVATRLIPYAEEEGAGLLAPFYTQADSSVALQAAEGGAYENGEGSGEEREDREGKQPSPRFMSWLPTSHLSW